MNRSEIFTIAHKLTARAIRLSGKKLDYKTVFARELRNAYRAQGKAITVENQHAATSYENVYRHESHKFYY